MSRVKKAARPGTIRVEPKNEAMRRVLKHPLTGVRFRAEGSAEWPNDPFTRNRLREGAIRLAEQRTNDQKQEAERINRGMASAPRRITGPPTDQNQKSGGHHRGEHRGEQRHQRSE